MALRTVRELVALGATLLLASNARAQGRIDGLDAARQFILTAYPELRGRGAVLYLPLVQPLDEPQQPRSHLELEVVGRNPEGVPSSNLKLLHAGFNIDADGGIDGFSASGIAVNTDKRARLEDEVDKHPAWSDERVLRLLAREGATFLPTQESAAKIIERRALALGSILGVLDLTSIEFIVREPTDADDRVGVASLEWSVTLKPRSADDAGIEYVLAYEPFEGKFVGFYVSSNP